MSDEPEVVNENLFKPGESGNPGGRVASPADIKALTKFNRFEMARVLHKYLHMPLDELMSIVHKDNADVLSKFSPMELGAINMAKSIALKGDIKAFNFVLDRLVGKARQEAEVKISAPETGNQGGVLILPPNGREK